MKRHSEEIFKRIFIQKNYSKKKFQTIFNQIKKSKYFSHEFLQKK